MTERAVVGVWPAGDTVRFIIESKGSRVESRRGLALDWGFLPGAEDEFRSDDGARGGGSVAGRRHGAIHYRVEGKSRRIAARSRAGLGIFTGRGGRVQIG